MSIKIISMTSNLKSYLAKNSDFILDVSIFKESCPNNLAPTTSTTVQLVMGDALAVSLLKLKNFTEEDFARFHPGGSLGNRLNLTVSDLCDINCKPLVFATDTLEKVIIEISSNRLGATAVMQDESVVGIITDGDLRRMLENEKVTTHLVASDLMTVHPKTIDQNELVYKAFSIMKKYSITQLLVMSDDNYCGIIHLHDIVKHNIF